MPRAKPREMPSCAYGTSCQRKGCVYKHPPKSKLKKPPEKSSKEICVHFIAGACTFGDKCANKHPGRKDADAFRETCARIACKFGEHCGNVSCLYSHQFGARLYVPRERAPSMEPEPEEEWWRDEDFSDVCDPISLEPLCELDYPPFLLTTGTVEHWFDGAVLAVYVVSSANFLNPMTREPLLREDCLALDDYLRNYGLDDRPRVTTAYDLLHSANVQGGGHGEITAIRREATTILQSLFGFDRAEAEEEPSYDAHHAAFTGAVQGAAHAVSFAPVATQRVGQAYHDSFAPRPPVPTKQDDARRTPDEEEDDNIAVGIAEAILRGDDDDDDETYRRGRRGYSFDEDYEQYARRPEAPPVEFSDAAFPSLPVVAAPRPRPPPPPGLSPPGLNVHPGLTFAGLTLSHTPVQPRIGADAAFRSCEREVRPTRALMTVKMPPELWTSTVLRNARVFELADPMERYAHVARSNAREDIVDLHFQSSRTAAVVLDAVLDAALARHSKVWLVTGSGHHTPVHSHQRSGGMLHAFCEEYLSTRGYDFAIAKDKNGYSGAFLVRPARAQGYPP
ncbi:hypothetical protein M885DRAFT_589750 [Pelagophyceae sp. CCMP2097]|nr:hypothetical protein M885DRAFT_589750 [Pelagophyceae sp. CCMP2097]